VEPAPSVQIEGNVSKSFFIIVGHNHSAQGASNYLKESEYSFNKRVAGKLQNYLADRKVPAYIILRPSGSYGKQVRSVVSQVKKIKKDKDIKKAFALLLHFNWASREIGCEFLVKKNDPTNAHGLADNLSDSLNEKLGIRERHDDGVYPVGSKHNGAGMIYALDDIEVYGTIAEPCAGNIRSKTSASIFEHEDRYVSILGDAVIKTLGS
jgi:hypothetical protein